MKKPFLKLSSAILSATMLMSSLTLFGTSATALSQDTKATETALTKVPDFFPTFATGDKSLSVERPADIKVISSVEDYCNIATANGADLKISGSATDNLPSKVDNSQTPYFPPIGDQGSLGSCSTWAGVYYQFTYTMNKQRNVASNYSNSFSPKFTYNLINNGWDSGAIYYEVYDSLKYNGSASMFAVPYDDNCTSWSPTEEVWKDAIKAQLKDYQVFEDLGTSETQITSVNDEDLLPIKTSLSNGDILTFSTYAYSFNVEQIEINASTPENTEYFNEYVVTHLNGGEGGHRMTIVGYNDDIWVDLNDNQIVDNGEMGAFKVANSWAEDYANNGFIWIAYDALNIDSCVTLEEENRFPIFDELSRIDVMPYNYSGDFYLKATLNSSSRYNSQIYFSADRNGSFKESEGISVSSGHSTMIMSYDGTKTNSDGTLVFPLKNAAPDLTAENFDEYTWTVTAECGIEDVSDLIVKDIELVNASANEVYKPEDVFPFTINGETKTIEFHKSTLNNIVVYYRGYNLPTLHYNVDGNWKTVSMENNTERRGYINKYVIPVSETATAKLYFTDNNGNTDDNNGKYYTATNGLNYFNTDSAREPLKAHITKEHEEYDVHHYPLNSGSATGGYGPYLYQFVYTNLDTNTSHEDKWSEAPKNPETEFNFPTEGNYRITLNVKDYSDKIVSDSYDVYVEDKPFIFSQFNLLQGDTVVAGQPVLIQAKTKNEQMMAWGDTFSYYHITIKKDGVTHYDNTIRSTSLDFRTRISSIKDQWTPYETGVYTMTISSTDFYEDYAESSYTFEVKDHKYGDVDCNTEINIRDATLIQMFIARFVGEDKINRTASDVNKDSSISISDATNIQMTIVNLDNSSYVGQVIPVKNPIKPTEPTTVPETTEPETTEPITDPDTLNKVYFTNVHEWSEPLYCYYWSDSNTKMTSWPGEQMELDTEYTFGSSVYTFIVPEDATYIIISSENHQTVDIPYGGGSIKYYPSVETDSNGKYPVFTW